MQAVNAASIKQLNYLCAARKGTHFERLVIDVIHVKFAVFSFCFNEKKVLLLYFN